MVIQSLSSTTSPFVSATANSSSSTIAVNGILTYRAEFIIDQQSIDSGRINNSVIVTAVVQEILMMLMMLVMMEMIQMVTLLMIQQSLLLVFNQILK